MSPGSAENLFVSYAAEDWPLAEWLTRKLTSFGYVVWCDRFKLLGGESYPLDIDVAIKERTFRVIALLSKNSINKPNPIKERTLALNIGRARNVDFLIPINVDGLNAIELDWMTNDLTYISFYPSWADGLNQLLVKFDEIGAPRPLANGRAIAIESSIAKSHLIEREEILHSNEFPIISIPPSLRRFRLARKLFKSESDLLLEGWAAYRRSHADFVAFSDPPLDLLDATEIASVEVIKWKEHSQVDHVNSSQIVSRLVTESLRVWCISRGLKPVPGESGVYFPSGILERNRISFKNYTGAKIGLLAVGQRRRRITSDTVEITRYHMAPTFRLVGRPGGNSAIQIQVEFYFTSREGGPLPPGARPRARKRLTRMWTNHHWLSRVVAIGRFLSDGDAFIRIGENESEQLVIDATPHGYLVPVGIDEESLGIANYDHEPTEVETHGVSE